jgi:hypothetical protein
MISRRAFTVSLGLLLVATSSSLGFAASGTPMTANFSTNLISAAYGVSGDGAGPYYNGVSGVQCYIGVAGKDLDLVTYNTARKLTYKFNTSQTAWQASKIPATFTAVSDFYGVNYYGQYMNQGIGTTAQVHGVLQFYVGNITYQLDYQSLASYRESANTWLITSATWPTDPLLPYGNPGFTASDQAALGVIRRKSVTNYGTVNMPIRFEVTLQ